MARRAITLTAIALLSLANFVPPLLITPREPLDGSPWPSDSIVQALVNSPTYCKILEVSDRPEHHLDYHGPAFLDVAVGCDVEIDTDLHLFERWATLRLFRGGAISKLGYDADGEYQWEPEYRP
jgi:hypothetical protein